ncbi:TlpA family protein disulfide reductase [Microbacterium oryzae]|uniref:TlpA family protein disulfide reductase n=1 Tax=Microbacterium oryzae TaxID=743009 RepID=UPI00156601C0|nr:TlpA disulfide reductase family protein [Microbacterium oryzae]
MARFFARLASAAAGAAVVSVLLASCTVDDALTTSFGEDSAASVSTEGRIQEIAPEDRGDPVEFEGVDEHGRHISSDDVEGVMVVNFWYAGCGPCRAEAPLLEDVWSEYAADGVRFIGVNIYDQADTALAFAETYGITYPSVIDADSGQVRQAFAGQTPLNATPSTLVLDSENRVAVRIVGQLPDASILSTLVADTQAQSGT